MSQNDFSVANANGSTVRADINSALQALASLSGGSSAPSTTYANMWWFDTTNDILKIRDEANANWVSAFSLSGTTWIPYSNGAVLGTIANLAYTAINQNLTMSAKHVAFAMTSVTSGTPDFATSGNVVTLSSTATANTLGTVQAGFIGIIHYAIAITLTHNGTSRILNNNGQNILTSAGDVEFALSLGSGNWRTIGYSRANGSALSDSSVLSKTASYTVTDADRGAVIRFSGLASDVTLTLPAAANRSGFEITIAPEDATYGITCDPNSTELIDGVSTRKTYFGTPVTIICDGTGWRTKSGSWRFRSALTAITAAAGAAVAHGLLTQPGRVGFYLQCNATDAGYSSGAKVYSALSDANTGAGTGVSVIADATNLTYRFGSGASVFFINHATTGALTAITLSKWDMVFTAES